MLEAIGLLLVAIFYICIFPIALVVGLVFNIVDLVEAIKKKK